MSAIPQELNWVERRAACTAAQVSNELRTGIENDISTLNAVRNLAEDQRFSAELSPAGTALAIGTPRKIPNRRIVVVAVADSRIQVCDDAMRELFFASLALNNEGRCVLRLNGETELELWQFRKKALEGLFFGD